MGLEFELFREPWRFDPAFLIRASRLLKRNPVEVIHLHRSRDLAAVSWLRGYPRVLTLQIESTLRKKDFFHRFVYSRVDRVLTITERMRGFVEQSLPVNTGRVFTLPYGIKPTTNLQVNQQPDLRAVHQIPSDAFVIGIVGRLEEPKGQDILLKAFARLYETYADLHLLIVGEPPREHTGYDQVLKELANSLGVQDRVHFTGFVADTSPVYAALDVCVLASKEETFGLVLLESMAAGVPLVATEAGGVPEIIGDGVNGLLVPPSDPIALSKALSRLHDDETLRRELSANGRRIVAERFSLERHLTSLEAHFDAVIRSHQQAGI